MRSEILVSSCQFAFRRLAFLTLLVALPVAQLHAQKDSCLNRTVAVNVTTEDGQMVKGLTASNFEAKMQGRHGGPIDITSVNYQAGFHRVVILLDTSGSMIGQPESVRWAPAVLAVKDLVAQAPPQITFAFVAFAEGAVDSVSFAQGRQALTERVENLDRTDWRHYKGPPRRTALLDAVWDAINSLQPPRAGDAIFLVSDGGENASKSRAKDVEQSLLQHTIRLFTFGILDSGGIGSRRPEEANGPALLQDLAQATGGDTFAFPPGLISEAELRRAERDAPKLIAAAARLAGQEMSEYYVLRIGLSQPIDKPREWKLEVMNEYRERDARWRVIYPHKLAACREGV